MVFLLVLLMLMLTARPTSRPRKVIAVVVLFLLSFIVLLTSFRRSRLGVAGVLGESMLVDLRDRILAQGVIPILPDGWYVESALRSAGGTPFAGDFVVTSAPAPATGSTWPWSTSPARASRPGTRALLLSGAFGGLLGALPPDEFLPAANDYLMRQDWAEGFATAVHLSLDLDTGDFEVRTAGHPPAVQLAAGSGRWAVLRDRGPGPRPDRGRRVQRARAARCAAATRCCSTPTAWSRPRPATSSSASTGCSARPSGCCAATSRAAAARLVDALGSPNDDRALLLVHRR